MRINLSTPFADKVKAKALGARWDSVRKNWYIVDVADLPRSLRSRRIWATLQTSRESKRPTRDAALQSCYFHSLLKPRKENVCHGCRALHCTSQQMTCLTVESIRHRRP